MLMGKLFTAGEIKVCFFCFLLVLQFISDVYGTLDIFCFTNLVIIRVVHCVFKTLAIVLGDLRSPCLVSVIVSTISSVGNLATGL